MTLVNWSEIDPKYKWAAMDGDSSISVFEHKPYIIYGCPHYWMSNMSSGKLIRDAGEFTLWGTKLEERLK